MDIELFIDKLHRDQEQLPEKILDALELRGQDAIASMQYRIQEQGLNSDMEQFTPYSEKYAERKKNAGKDVGFVNLTYNDRMLNNIDVTKTAFSRDNATIVVAAKNQEDQDKVDNNSALRPFMNLSRDEQIFMHDDLVRDTEEIVQSFMK